MKKWCLLLVILFCLPLAAHAGVDCKNMIPCKYSRAGTECENQECIAIILQLSQPLTLNLTGALFAQPGCKGGNTPFDATVDLPAGTQLLYLVVPSCPAGFPYSANVKVNECDILCSDFICADPDTPVNCEALNAELPAVNIQDLQ